MTWRWRTAEEEVQALLFLMMINPLVNMINKIVIITLKRICWNVKKVMRPRRHKTTHKWHLGHISKRYVELYNYKWDYFDLIFMHNNSKLPNFTVSFFMMPTWITYKIEILDICPWKPSKQNTIFLYYNRKACRSISELLH